MANYIDRDGNEFSELSNIVKDSPTRVREANTLIERTSFLRNVKLDAINGYTPNYLYLSDDQFIITVWGYDKYTMVGPDIDLALRGIALNKLLFNASAANDFIDLKHRHVHINGTLYLLDSPWDFMPDGDYPHGLDYVEGVGAATIFCNHMLGYTGDGGTTPLIGDKCNAMTRTANIQFYVDKYNGNLYLYWLHGIILTIPLTFISGIAYCLSFHFLPKYNVV